MQSIERYAVVILLFLIVIVAGVLIYNSSDEPGAPEVAAAERDMSTDLASRGPRAGTDVVGLRTNPQRNRPLSRGREREAREAEVTQPPLTTTPPARREEVPSAGAGITRSSSEPPPAGVLQGTPVVSPQAPPANVNPSPTGGRTTPVESEPLRRDRPRETPANLYVVQPGDTLSQIAMEKLGTWKRWKEIVDANPGLDESKLKVGARLMLPSTEAAPATTPTAVPAVTPRNEPRVETPASAPASARARRTWKVAEGESLWKIAERALGDGALWGEIAKANPEIDVNKLKVGQTLRLPEGARAERESSRERSQPEVAAAAPAPAASSTPRGKVR